jgi:hypothetical protein
VSDTQLRAGLFRWWCGRTRGMRVGTFSEMVQSRLEERDWLGELLQDTPEESEQPLLLGRLRALEHQMRAEMAQQAGFVDRGRKSAFAGLDQSKKPRERLTKLEQATGLVSKAAAAKEVRRRILKAIEVLQKQDGLHSDQRPDRWAERLSKVVEPRVSAGKIHEALPKRFHPWRAE